MDKLFNINFYFYNLLLKKSHDELYKNNFSRSEIYQGLEAIKSFSQIKRLSSKEKPFLL
ncbi:DUF6483 family protein [Clostridium grantii]|uniref:DUF6483 family protein n=1 Tax=Clostridium grantii TaxID=40575 RepID=UPI001FA86F36|nr:DUF6483 family protein [Clostridium grantii]